MREAEASRTAQYVAVVRAVLTDRGWLDDPHAAGMLTPPMVAVRRGLTLPGARRLATSPFFAALAARTLWFDGEARRAVGDGIDQLVVVGAGYDSRAWRLAAPGVRWFEVDHPATQADKRRRAPAGPGPAYVAADLGTTTVATALGGSRFDPHRPAAFLLEGVTMYLSPGEVRALLGHLADASAPGSRLAVGFAAPPGSGGPVERVRTTLVRLGGRSVGEPHLAFATVPDARSIVGEAGWHVDEATTLLERGRALLRGTPLPIERVNPVAPLVAAST